MPTFKIIHDREACIGCGACIALAPEHWEMNADGKADLKGAKESSEGIFEIEKDISMLKENKEAVESCPVICIRIEEKK